MQAVAVLPGKRDSLHLRDVPAPSVEEIPDGRGVLVDVVRVGVDGTDREIVDALFGAPPEGDDFLIIGHESLGRVAAAGAGAPDWAREGALVVATVRRPGGSIYDRIGLQDMTTDPEVRERGINRLHGFLAESYVDDAAYLVPLPEVLAEVGVLLEPLSIVEKGIRQAFEIQRRMRVWEPRRAVVVGAGSIGLLATLALRLRGLDVIVYSRRVPPYRNSRLAEAIGARYVSSSRSTLTEVCDRSGAPDLVIEASGYSPLAFQAADVLASNGVLVLTSVTGENRTTEVRADRINLGFVLGNKVMVGTVNAHRDDFVTGVADLLRAEAAYPGWLGSLLTTPIGGLDGYGEMIGRLREDDDAIKVYVEL
ncbi:MAG TPA: glucose 1-dehydrogenase [Candidatus Limnocylindrales bacterium]